VREKLRKRLVDNDGVLAENGNGVQGALEAEDGCFIRNSSSSIHTVTNNALLLLLLLQGRFQRRVNGGNRSRVGQLLNVVGGTLLVDAVVVGSRRRAAVVFHTRHDFVVLFEELAQANAVDANVAEQVQQLNGDAGVAVQHHVSVIGWWW